MNEHQHSRRLRVFISYTSENREEARKLARKLNRDGFEPWYDKERLLPGQDWNLEIEKALRSAGAIVILLSDLTVSKSGFVQKEIKQALDFLEYQPEGAIYLIPVRLCPCEVSLKLRARQWVDLFRRGGYALLRKSLQERAESLGLPRSISGIYMCTGTNPDGSRYSGRAAVHQKGELFTVKWEIADKVFKSSGYRKGNQLVVHGDYTVHYTINDDGTLVGSWGDKGIDELIPVTQGYGRA